MEEKVVDRRVRKTKRQLRLALMKLMSEKSVKDISVRELAAIADINRGTFYIHYKDVYDLLSSLEDELADGLTVVCRRHNAKDSEGKTYPYLMELYQFIQQNSDLCHVLLGKNGDIAFTDRICHILRDEFLYDFLAYYYPNDPVMLDYFCSFIVSGNMSLALTWIDNGMKQTPEEMAVLAGEGLLEPVANSCTEDSDITRHPLELPCDRPEDRSVRLQVLARADEGFLLSMAYSVQRGANHPFVGELRRGTAELSFTPEELGFSVTIGEIEITECEIVGQYVGTAMEPCFARGYGLVFGNNERKVLSMAIVDRALRARELEERIVVPSQIPEFVLLHSDSVEASGFVQHIKLPHYVDFQAQLSLIRGLRAKSGKKEENQE